jgi:hypothetical protein
MVNPAHNSSGVKATMASRSFEQLFWPAVAGNVAWSLCSVVISPGQEHTEILPRFSALLLLSWYAWYSWLQFATIPYRPRSYYFMDALHLITLSAFAIATGNHHPYMAYFLAAIFLVAGFGHLFGSFDRSPDEKCCVRLKRAGANTVGVIVLCFGQYLGAWDVPLALLLVLIFWWKVQGLHASSQSDIV